MIEEDDPEVDHAGGACDLVVFVRRASDPEGRYPIHLSLAVGRRWWSVCRVDFGFPGDRPAAHVSISGSTAFAATDVEPPGTVSADASFRYASGERIASLGEHVDLGFVPDSSGSVVIRFLNAAGEAVAAWAVALPAGDVRIGNPTDPVLTSGPMPVVVGRNGVLGWWDGGRWRDADVQRAEDLPYEPGDEFAVAGVDGTASTAIAGEPTGHEYCGSASVDNRVAFRPTLDPPIPNEFDALEPRVAVRAGWDISPRSPSTLDLASAAYVEVVADVLRGRGIEDVPVVLRQALRVDLDGNGTEEVLLAAEHPDAHPGGGPLAGWYSVVLLRQLVDDEVATTPLLLTTFTSDNPHNYPTHATHRLTAVADLNGDGTMEIVTDTRYFESSATEVFELQTDGAGARRVLSAGCGV